ncbi:hypothetical protein [Aporhodopirellula aestuarii]|uniref:Secreted protein n=1 Tax=Aporhodopirellula aestuarii TaxID=2950107 RepID=A0ABT0U0R1_9BACT|nr:hypothetical protein [Aporhodopirellula aestuarii]MCM2370459.1 hypothetical protein [Aporhodopirellula aestuarii]
MHAIEFRPLRRRFFCNSFGPVLAGAFGLTVISTLGGCSQGRMFSPLASRRTMDNSAPSMHGPSLGGPAEMSAQAATRGQANANQISVTSENAVPETEIEPVEQRLATPQTGRSAQVRQVSHQTNQSTPAKQAEQQVEVRREVDPDMFAQNIAQAANVSPAKTGTKPSLSDTSLDLPDGYDGVDVTELMSALRDAPPEIQKAAIARLIAMSRKRARPSTRPRGIEEALAASFDSLPELPEEVVDRGVSPTRIGGGPASAANTASSPESRPDVKTVSAVASMREDGSSAIHTAAHETLSDLPEEGAMDVANVDVADSAYKADENVSLAVIQPPIASTAATSTPPAFSPADMTDAEMFDALVARLQKKVPGESEADRHRRQVVARHLMVLAGDPDRAVDNLEGLSNEEQEYLRHQLLGLWTIIDPKGHPVPSHRFSSALPEIRKATGYLAAASNSLEVRSLEFCTEIESYGQIKPFPSRRFAAGQEVILYCEIENFVAQSVEGGFETRLQGSYDLLDQNGRRVSSQTLPEDQQISKNRLRDYFIAYQMYLPDSIEPGNYQLRLTMEDVNGKKYGQSTVDFQIKR